MTSSTSSRAASEVDIIRRIRHLLGKADNGWEVINDHARQHLSRIARVRSTRSFEGDPVIEAEYRKAERLVAESARKVEQS
jgi:hypothetical protein